MKQLPDQVSLHTWTTGSHADLNHGIFICYFMEIKICTYKGYINTLLIYFYNYIIWKPTSSNSRRPENLNSSSLETV